MLARRSVPSKPGKSSNNALAARNVQPLLRRLAAEASTDVSLAVMQIPLAQTQTQPTISNLRTAETNRQNGVNMVRHSTNSISLRCILIFIILRCWALGAAAPATAPNANKLPTVLRDVGIDQKLNHQIPLDLVFREETGNAVMLRQYFGQKPVVLALVYYDCPMLCTLVLNGLLHSLKDLTFTAGQEFEVVTVSFDPTEKTSLAAAKKAIYVGLYGRPGAVKGWHFLTGDESSIRQLAQSVGFRYNYDVTTRQYVHATGIMVLTPQGRLARYFYGIQYPAGNLRKGLVEASQGTIGSPVDELLLYCSQYDPGTGKYSVIISRVLKLAAAITALSLGALVLALARGGKRKTT
jgi:protein SCO1